MYNHEPEGYICPFCLVIQGVENDHLLTKQADIVYKDEYVTAFIGASCWENNKGNVIIVPNKHYENIYDIPSLYLHKISDLTKELAIAFKKVYLCDGVYTRQHNEPCGNQDVWHYHMHVFPRYKDDNLYMSKSELCDPDERLVYANKLKAYFMEKDMYI